MPWRTHLQSRANQPPACARDPLLWRGQVLGSLAPLVSDALLMGPMAVRPDVLMLQMVQGRSLLQLQGSDLSSTLAVLAEALRQLGMAGAWRNELLAIRNAQGQRLGAVERGVVRQLGIATEAVHLVGFAPDGQLWVQQRSLTKANDPGLWDTLMGGMVSDADTLETALQRETWEEAGLRTQDLQDLQARGLILQQRPSDDGAGGYLQESTHWYTATVPEHLHPVNQDGEVAQFARLSPQEVELQVSQGHYTLEASLILAKALRLV